MSPLLDRLEDHSCEPIERKVNIEKLKDNADLFVQKLFEIGGGLFTDWQQNRNKYGMAALNLTHAEGVVGLDRFFKHTGNRLALADAGLDEGQFVVLPKEVESTYIGRTIKMIEDYHFEKFNTPFKGRCQFIWVDPGSCYPLHVDTHTPHRYHIPIHTNSRCWWVFCQNEEIDLLHMPADGRIWYLDPIQREHSVANFSLTPRLHLLMTSSL
jgi:hypothetical protein